MTTDANTPAAVLVFRRLLDARAHTAEAEALLGSLAADRDNTMDAVKLLTAATLCALAEQNLKHARAHLKEAL